MKYKYKDWKFIFNLNVFLNEVCWMYFYVTVTIANSVTAFREPPNN